MVKEILHYKEATGGGGGGGAGVKDRNALNCLTQLATSGAGQGRKFLEDATRGEEACKSSRGWGGVAQWCTSRMGRRWGLTHHTE